MINKRLRLNIIDISAHLMVAAIGSLVIYTKSHNAWYAFLFFAGGVLIDLDHLVDYFICFGPSFRPVDFFSSASTGSGKVYVLLHSWELAAALMAAGILAGVPGLCILSAGGFAHLIVDSLMRRKFHIYFLSYRIARKFDFSEWPGSHDKQK